MLLGGKPRERRPVFKDRITAAREGALLKLQEAEPVCGHCDGAHEHRDCPSVPLLAR